MSSCIKQLWLLFHVNLSIYKRSIFPIVDLILIILIGSLAIFFKIKVDSNILPRVAPLIVSQLTSLICFYTGFLVIKQLDTERETKIKKHLMANGLKKPIYVISLILSTLPKTFIYAFVLTAVGLQKINLSFVYTYLMALLFMIYFTSMANFIGTFNLNLFYNSAIYLVAFILHTYHSTHRLQPNQKKIQFIEKFNPCISFSEGIKAVLNQKIGSYLFLTALLIFYCFLFILGTILIDRFLNVVKCGFKKEALVSDSPNDLKNVAIRVKNLVKRYNSKTLALNNLSFDVCHGEIFAFIGPNGSGKSTLYEILTGTLLKTSGNFYINDKNDSNQIAYCPQHNPLYTNLTVKEHLTLYAYLNNSSMDLKSKIEELALKVQLHDKLDKRVDTLSGGLKRRLCLGIALINESQILLLDEPTCGLDLESRNEFCNLLKQIKQERTLLLSTHYMDELEVADKIGIIFDGQIFCQGSFDELKRQYGAGYVLSIVTNNELQLDDVIESIMTIVINSVPNASVYEKHGHEFLIVLPVQHKNQFADMFQKLETHKNELGIFSFGLSLNTFDQVFERICKDKGLSNNAVAIEIEEFYGDSNIKSLYKHYFYHLTVLIHYCLLSFFKTKKLEISINILCSIFMGFYNIPKEYYQLIMLICVFILTVTIFAVPSSDKQSGFRSHLLRTQVSKNIYWLANILSNGFLFILSLMPIFVSSILFKKESLNFPIIALTFYISSTTYYLPVVIQSINLKNEYIFYGNIIIASILHLCNTIVKLLACKKLQILIDAFGIVFCPIYPLGKITFYGLDNEKALFISLIIWSSILWIYILVSETSIFNKIYRSIYQKTINLNSQIVEKQNLNDLALNIHKINRYFGKLHAVNDLSFQVKTGECVALLGINSSGKTTTFNLITNKLYSNSGEITIYGFDSVNHPLIGYCAQFNELPDYLTGKEVLSFIGKLSGLANVENCVNKMLNYIDLNEKANYPIEEYSGGQKRRLSVGISLMMKAKFIILDEPTNGIDPISRQKIWKLLKAVNQTGVAILLTSHNMFECETLAHRVCFMNNGKLEQSGTSQELKIKYRTGYLLTFTLEHPNQTNCQMLNKIVTREFNTPDTKDSFSNSIQHWNIPNKNQALSSLFRKAQQITDNYPILDSLNDIEKLQIKDFSLTQSSFEQIFLNMAQK